jgi:hypothetical protein
MSANERLEEAARLFDEAAEQLEQAAAHCRDQEVPRGGAHAWAAHGHIRAAEDALDEQARTHAARSNP